MAKPKLLTNESAKTYISELAEALKSKYMKRNDLLELVRTRRFLENKPIIPNVYAITPAELRATDVFDFIRRTTAIIGGSRPTPMVIPAKLGPDAQANATKREKWIEAAERKLDEDNLYLKLCDAAMADGMAVVKLNTRLHLWDFNRLEDEEAEDYNKRVDERRRKIFPFFAEHVPTYTYYPVKEGGRIVEVVEVSKREARPLFERYGLSYDRNARKWTHVGARVQWESGWPSIIDFVEYWSEYQVIYLIDDVIVKNEKHGYGRVPYYEARALITSSPDPAHEALPPVYPLVNLQDLKDCLTTIRLNWAIWTGMPQITLDPISEESILPVNFNITQVEVKLDRAYVYMPPPGFRLNVLRFPEVGNEMAAMHRTIEDEIQNASLAPILKGILPGADVTGVAAMTMVAIAKSILGPAMHSLTRLYDDMAGFMQECVEKVLKQPVPLWVVDKEKNEWLELGPDDIKGYYEVRHRLETIIPGEQYARGQFYADQQARGAIPMEMHREIGLGLPNPEEIGLKVELENLRQDPQYKSSLWKAFFAWLEEEHPEWGFGTQAVPPVGPGGVGIPMQAGIQHPLVPGGEMAMMPPGPGGPMAGMPGLGGPMAGMPPGGGMPPGAGP